MSLHRILYFQLFFIFFPDIICQNQQSQILTGCLVFMEYNITDAVTFSQRIREHFSTAALFVMTTFFFSIRPLDFKSAINNSRYLLSHKYESSSSYKNPCNRRSIHCAFMDGNFLPLKAFVIWTEMQYFCSVNKSTMMPDMPDYPVAGHQRAAHSAPYGFSHM